MVEADQKKQNKQIKKRKVDKINLMLIEYLSCLNYTHIMLVF